MSPSESDTRERLATAHADRLATENARLREELENERKFSAATRECLAALEAEAKQAREDEAWAEGNHVVIDAEPVTKGWCAMVVIEDGPLIHVPTEKGPTIAAAIRALRAKVEGGGK